MISDNQLPARFRSVIDAEIETYKSGAAVQDVNSIPDTTQIPSAKTSQGQTRWLRIPDVICIYADMRNSTGLTAEKQDKSAARAYQLFTETAVRIFHAAESAYIDVQGDGVFALFDSGQVHRALGAAVTFKTFAVTEFIPRVTRDLDVDVGCHLGMDARTTLVRKLGLRPKEGRTDRQNEVWAGRTINMAAKLAAQAADGELIASERAWKKLSAPEALQSCGCPDGIDENLWEEIAIVNPSIDFTRAYVLKPNWCSEHGAEFCESLFAADK